MSAIQPCEPLPELAVAISTSTSNGTVPLPAGFNRFLVTCTGSDCYWKRGTTATASATGNMIIPAGSSQMLTIQATDVAAITASGTGVLQFVPVTGGV